MRDLVSRLVAGENLSEGESRDLLDALTDPTLDPVLGGAALVALRAKGETAEEIRGFALRLRELAVRPEIGSTRGAVDVVGTGGDGSGSFNLSTGSALLAAAAGIPVVKHGNRAVSSRSGSADVLAALGLDVPLIDVGHTLARTGFTFLFAPAYHPAMKAIGPVRQALGMRTIFNIAGPLANPAAPPFAVIGAYSREMAETMAHTLAGMPVERAFVVHGEPGWDEPTPIGPYHLYEVVPGSVTHTVEDPADFELPRCQASDLIGGGAEFNAGKLREVFAGASGPHRDALVLGASLALRVTGTPTAESVATAALAIDDGRATRLVDELRETANV